MINNASLRIFSVLRPGSRLNASLDTGREVNALKAAVSLLSTENRQLQQTLEEERRFSAELRFALKS